MKKIPKGLLDRAIEETRKFWNSDNADALREKHKLAKRLDAETNTHWSCFESILSVIIQRRGFAPNCPNETIYAVLNVLGWEVVDENESEDC